MVFSKLRASLSRTRNRISHALRRLSGDATMSEALEALEEVLYTADVGALAGELIEQAEQEAARGSFDSPADLSPWLHERLSEWVQGPSGDPLPPQPNGGPRVLMIVGVNGAGKTTSIAKMVQWLRDRGDSVLVGAGDTFRAAAVEQLQVWCDRADVQLVKGAQGADPAAVAHDAASAAVARGVDYLVLDTAGRLHTQKNLMSELEKISRVLGKIIPDAPHETILILDATTGQNAVQQARLFGQSVPLSGVVLAKLDGTAKGGAVLSIGRELQLPVKFAGLGEGIHDLEVFDPTAYVNALLDLDEVPTR